MATIKISGGVLGCASLVYVVILYPSLAITGAFIGAVLVACSVLFMFVGHFHRHGVEIQLNSLDVEHRKAEIRALEVQMQIAMMQASTITAPSTHVVLERSRGGGMTVMYAPLPKNFNRVLSIDEVLEQSDNLPALPAPKLNARQLLGQAQADEVIMGSDEQGNIASQTWKRLRSILILGLAGGGKTSTLAWLTAQAVRDGARLAVIDKHARSEDDSLASKLSPFESSYVTSIGDSPIAASRVIRFVRGVLESRLEGARVEYPLFLLVDEFTAIMREATNELGKWHNVAVELADLLEAITSEGRKVKVFTICSGQAANASRTGGTELRELFNTRIYHNMREQQSRLVSMTDSKKEIKALRVGQVLVDLEGLTPIVLTVPYLSDDDLSSVARAFRVSASWVQTDETTVKGIDTENETNELVKPIEQLEPSEQRARKVLKLREQGIGKGAIIEEIWGVKKGGSEKYKQAAIEYEAIK